MLQLVKKYSYGRLPFTTGWCWGEPSLLSPSLGLAASSDTVEDPKLNEGTNSTAFTFNVENFAVTSVPWLGLLLLELLSAWDSQLSGAVLWDIFAWCWVSFAEKIGKNREKNTKISTRVRLLCHLPEHNGRNVIFCGGAKCRWRIPRLHFKYSFESK